MLNLSRPPFSWLSYQFLTVAPPHSPGLPEAEAHYQPLTPHGTPLALLLVKKGGGS
jgi:hypothetical protein